MNTKKPSLGRHRRTCSVCRHIKCAEIETDFIAWRSPAAITEEYGLSDRSSTYRHAHALGLFAKRQRNVRAALEHIIERAGEVEVTAASVVAAVQAYSKINSMDQWIDRSETVDLNELFDRMTRDELETYAHDGSLPGWFTDTWRVRKQTTMNPRQSQRVPFRFARDPPRIVGTHSHTQHLEGKIQSTARTGVRKLFLQLRCPVGNQA